MFLQRFFLTALLFFLSLPIQAIAAQATFSWLPNSDTNLAGYKIHYGTVSRTYTTILDVGLPDPIDDRIHGTVTGLTDGNTYYFAATAYETEGNESDYSDEIVHCIGCDTVVETAIFSGADDAEENMSSGAISLTSSDLEMVEENSQQLVGLRFNNLDIPQDATITNAWIQFTVDESATIATNLTIEGEYVSDAAPFTISAYNISSRDRTLSNVEWQPPAWSTVGASGADQQTPDLKDIVQEIVSLYDWANGNSMAFIISGAGKRVAESYNGVASAAAVLHVEYNIGPPVNQPPVVNAGADQSVTLPADTAVLDGTATDDGLPADTLHTEWQHVGGTGTGSVTFADPYAVDTTVTFGDSGTYVLELTADDSDLIRVDSMTVTVLDAAELIALTVTPDFVTVSVGNTVQFSATGSDQYGNSFSIDADWESTCGTISTFGLYTAPSIVGECIVSASVGEVNNTATVTVTEEPVEPTVVETIITSGADDAEENMSSGAINLTSSDLEMVEENSQQLVGLRFNNLDIPQDATITNAWIQFTVDESATIATNLTIEGEYVSDAAAFSTSAYNISSRDRTLSSVEWQPPAWSTVGASGADQQTPDLKDIVQEIVSLYDWASDNSMVFVISGEGKRVADSYNGAASAAAVLHVEFTTGSPVNQPPVAQTAALTTQEDTPVNGQLTADDPEGDPLTYVMVSAPAQGTALINNNGTFSYTPDTNSSGMDSFSFKVNDGIADSAPATVTITVNPVNDAPVAQNSTLTTQEDTAVNGQLTADDPEGDPLTYIMVSAPAQGTASINNNGTFSYTPNTNSSGTDSFSFKVNDGIADSAPATVTITVNPVNDAPVAQNSALTTQEDTAVNGQLTADDPEGDPLTYIMVSAPAQGTASINNNGTFSYTPDTNSSGTDSFSFKVNDGIVDSAPATVTITINPVNDAPVAQNSAITVNAGSTTSGQLTATDPEGETVTFSMASSPDHGSVTISAEGTFTYTADNNGSENDSFNFQASDGTNTSNIATVSITITPADDTMRFEIGELQVSSDWQTVHFTTQFTNPVVIAGVSSFNDAEPGVVRVNNVTADGFEVRFQEWDYLDDIHPEETVTFMVMEQGHFTLDDGTQVESGCFSTSGASSFSTVSFDQAMAVAPVIHTSVATYNGDDAVTTRVRNISTSGFDFMMREQEINDAYHVSETACYIAWEPSQGEQAGISYDVAATGDEVTDSSYLITYGQQFTESPMMLAAMQSTDGGDTANTRITENTVTGTKVFISEEQSQDSETSHTSETVGYIAIGTYDPLEDPEPTVVETVISSGADDAEENMSSGAINLTSSDLEMVEENSQQLVGLRFNNLDIPQDATITKAWIQFTVDESATIATILSIEGEYAGDAAPFTASAYNISSRDRTVSNVEWQPSAWSTVGASGPDQQTTNLKDIVQEIVSLYDWDSDNSMVFIISGEGKRVAESYDGVASAAAVLHVEFTTGSTVNQPPVVNAGADQSVTLSADTAVLDGTVTDDGLPVGTLDTEWQHVGGTGTGSVTFADPYAVDTTVTFGDSGTYILELTADDSEIIRVDSMTVTVLDAAELIALTTTPDFVTVSVGNTVQFSATGTDQYGNFFSIDADWESTCGTISPSGLYAAPSIAGECVITASVGELYNTATVTVTEEQVEPTVVEMVITSGADDAEENMSSGAISLSSSDLEMVEENSQQLVGLRFNNLDIPQDATITNAWIQFTVDESTTDFTSLTIEGESIGDAATFTTAAYNISSRDRTLSAVEWQPPAWPTAGASGPDQQTADIKDIVQEIVSLYDWASDNSMVFIISGEGKRVAESYNGVAAAAAVLYVEFNTGI